MPKERTEEQLRDLLKTWKLRDLHQIFNKIQSRNQRIWRSLSQNLSELRFECKAPPTSTLLFGEVGTGKTHKAFQIMVEWCWLRLADRKRHKNWEFTTVLGFLEEIKHSFNSADVDEAAIMSKYKNCDLLILDDIGVEKPTDWMYQCLYSLICHRYDFEKTTIYTSNKSLQEIAELWEDDRLTSRIAHDCGENIYEFTGDYKRKI